MINFEKYNIEGCSEAVDAMKGIMDEIASLSSNRIQIKDQITKLQKEVLQARKEQDAADERGDRKAFERAFDQRGTLLAQIDTAEKDLEGIRPAGLGERYEKVRRLVYQVEQEARDGLKEAQKKVEDRKPLRGLLNELSKGIGELNG